MMSQGGTYTLLVYRTINYYVLFVVNYFVPQYKGNYNISFTLYLCELCQAGVSSRPGMRRR